MPYKKTELAWAAGFFDGEGCTTAHCGYGAQRLAPRLRVSQNGNEGSKLLHRFKWAIKLGKVYGPYPIAKNQNLPIYYFGITNHDEVKLAIKLLWPYLSLVKRRQYKKVVAAYKADRKNW